jgi:formylglycine-generating enzyme required for sulfatase activity
VPRWRKLHEKYRDRGLRLVVVSVGEQGCHDPGWTPDDWLCDDEHRIQEQWGANPLPQAWLFSWQGNRLAGRASVEQVERAVERYFRDTPAIAIAPPEGEGGKPLPAAAAAELDGLVRGQFKVWTKFDLVASDRERSLIERSRRESQAPGRSEIGQCELGQEVSANSVLKVRTSGGSGGRRESLALELLSVEKGCTLAYGRAPVGAGGRPAAVVDAVAALLRQLVAPPGSGPPVAPTPVRPTGPEVRGGTIDDGASSGGPVIEGPEVKPTLGRLIVQVTPREATVTVTGPNRFHATGGANWEQSDLKPGAYTVEAAAPGHEPKRQSATIGADDTQVVKVTLDRLGALEITGTPAGARVQVTGPAGFSAEQGLPLTVRGAASGEYRIRASQGGHEAEEYTATVRRNETARVAVALKPPGSLEVRGTPEGAEVRVTGPGGFSATRGLPLTVSGAPRGSYRVKVSREGYEVVEREVEVRPGERAVVEVTLGKEAAGMVRVPAGCFEMGSNDGEPDEKPPHRVCLSGFRIDRTEVTNADYARCVAAGACADVRPHQASLKGGPYNLPKQPVVGVDWNDAATYCRWAGKRLPTEAEWEYAARGTDGRKYPWGNALDCSMASYGAYPELAGNCPNAEWCVCRGRTPQRPAEVGAYPRSASPFGALDMAGNVWEWVADWYASNFYASSSERNPVGPPTGSERVLRGGSWNCVAGYLRSAYRGGNDPTGRLVYIGFRCVRSAPE